MVKFAFPLQGAQVQSLVRELRSHMLCVAAKKKKRKKKLKRMIMEGSSEDDI